MQDTPLTVTSRDGTAITYDTAGEGPAVILVAGTMCSRSFRSGPELAALLAPSTNTLTRLEEVNRS